MISSTLCEGTRRSRGGDKQNRRNYIKNNIVNTVLGLLALLCGPAQGALHTLSSNALIPDRDRHESRDISGGSSGDSNAYLSPDGTLVPLPKRMGGSDGFGSGSSGMNIAPADAGSDTHEVRR